MSQNRRMRYLGSKGSVVERVLDLIGTRIPNGTLCDPFGGIGTVGAAAKRRGYAVSAGDQLAFAHAFQVARIEASRRSAFKKLEHFSLHGASEVERHLSALPPRDGWIVREYAQERQFFTQINAEKLEAANQKIASWAAREALSVQEEKVLRASLVDSADRVANTAGTYYAYLKNWHRKALKPFEFRLLTPTPGNAKCKVWITDAQDLVSSRPWDVLYLDPPFNSRNYGRYYHFPESLALGAKYEVAGKAGMPVRDVPRSPFYSPSAAATALRSLIDQADYKLLVLHYAPDGIIPADTIVRELKQRGKVRRYVLDAKGYTTRPTPRRRPHHLYLVHA
jgi:adenine-specific DNA-methyltransferase